MIDNELIQEEINVLNQAMNMIPFTDAPLYRNEGMKRQCSVCMILRINPELKESFQFEKVPESFNQSPLNRLANLIKQGYKSLAKTKEDVKHFFEIMFIQRAENPNDRHSSQVAFPGGKNEDNEDDLMAAVREADEECGLKLEDRSQYVFLGKLPKNFFVYPTPKGKLYVSVNIFLQLPITQIPVTLNASEVHSCFWVPLRYLLNPPITSFVHTKPYKMRLPQSKNKILFKLIEFFTSDVENGYMWQITLPEGQALWGLTFGFILYFFGFIRRAMDKSEVRYIRANPLDQILDKGMRTYLTYSTKGVGTTIRKIVSEKMYDLYRQDQFRNKKSRSSKYFIIIFGVLLFYMLYIRPRL